MIQMGVAGYLHKTLVFFSEMQFLSIIDSEKAEIISTLESKVYFVDEDFQWILNTEKMTWLY